MTQHDAFPQPVAYPAPARPFSGAAIAAFVLSLLWLGGVGSLVGLVLALKAMSDTRTGAKAGQGLAVAAVILCILGLLLSVVLIFTVVLAGQQEMEYMNRIAGEV